MISKYPSSKHSEPSGEENVRTPAPTSRRTRLFLWIFSAILVITAGTAFIFKLIEFYYTATKEGSDALHSFLIPVLNYLMVAAGFGCLLAWAWVQGHYKDVEAPKYRMLDMQEEIDKIESIKA